MMSKDTFNVTEDNLQSNRNAKTESEVLFQLKEIPIYAKYLRFYNFFALILIIILGIFGGILLSKSLGLIGICLIVISIILLVSFLFGNFAVNSYEKAADNETTLENIDQSFERTLVNFYIYLLLIFFFIFLIIAIVCLCYRTDITSYIDQLAYNKQNWQKVFGNYSYKIIMDGTKFSINFTGYLCIFFTLYIVAGLYFVFNMLDVYRSFQAIVQFLCIVFFAIGMCLLYVAQYAYRFIEIIDTEQDVADWIPNALFIVSIITILVSIIGFIAHYSENKDYLTIFGAVSVCFTIAILVFSVVAFKYSGNIQSLFMQRCNYLIDLVEENFLIESLGCPNKYSQKNLVMEELNCSKNRILYIWENNINKEVKDQKDEWGCINEECCSITYSAITKSSNILCVIALVLFLSGVIMSFGTIYVYSKLASGIERPPSNNSKSEKITLIGFVVIIATLVTIMSENLPKKPKIDDSRFDPIIISNNSIYIIDANSVGKINITDETQSEKKNITNDIKQESTIQEKNNCTTGCPVIKYFYELSSKEGKFYRNNTIDYSKKNITITEENNTTVPYFVKFNGNVGDLNGYTEYFIYEHDCPLFPANINVKIYAKAFSPQPKNLRSLTFLENTDEDFENYGNFKNILNLKISKSIGYRNLQNSNQSIEIKPIVVDVSNMTINETRTILNKDFDFSFVSNDTQIVVGTVKQVLSLNQSIPENNTKITLQNLDFAQCKSQVFKTNEKGDFLSNPLYVFNDGMKTEYLIKIDPPVEKNLTKVQSKFIVGGFGFSQKIDFGEILLWSDKMTEQVPLAGLTLDAVTNKPLEGVKISLFEGYLSENNNLLIPTNVTVTNTESNKLLEQVESNTEGNYMFKGLGPGRYTVLLEKSNFYTEYYCKTLNLHINFFNNTF